MLEEVLEVVADGGEQHDGDSVVAGLAGRSEVHAHEEGRKHEQRGRVADVHPEAPRNHLETHVGLGGQVCRGCELPQLGESLAEHPDLRERGEHFGELAEDGGALLEVELATLDDGLLGVEEEEDEEEEVGDAEGDEGQLDGEDVDEHDDRDDGSLDHVGEGEGQGHVQHSQVVAEGVDQLARRSQVEEARVRPHDPVDHPLVQLLVRQQDHHVQARVAQHLQHEVPQLQQPQQQPVRGQARDEVRPPHHVLVLGQRAQVKHVYAF